MDRQKTSNREEEFRENDYSNDKGQESSIHTDVSKGEEDEVFLKDIGQDAARMKNEMMVEKKVVDMEGRDPFVRRSALRRTPPIHRTLSTPNTREGRTEVPISCENAAKNVGGGDKEKDQEKRKRQEDSPVGAVNNDKQTKKSKEEKQTKKVEELVKSKLLRGVMELLKRVEAGVAKLHAITTHSRNTKVEIKEQADELARLMYSLMAKDLTKLDAREEVKRPGTREMGTQVNLGSETKKKRIGSVVEVSSLEGCETLEQWRTIASRRWDPKLYSNTDIKDRGEIMDTDDETVKVITVGKGDQGHLETSGWKGCERFPELNMIQEDYAIL